MRQTAETGGYSCVDNFPIVDSCRWKCIDVLEFTLNGRVIVQ